MRLWTKSATTLALTGLISLLLPSYALGQVPGDVSVAIGHTPDDPTPNLTVYADQTNYLQIWIQNDDDVLDESELYRLSYGAEHPETTDPLLYFLPAKRK